MSNTVRILHSSTPIPPVSSWPPPYISNTRVVASPILPLAPQIFFTKKHGLQVGTSTPYKLPRNSIRRNGYGKWEIRYMQINGRLSWKPLSADKLPAKLRCEALLLGVVI